MTNVQMDSSSQIRGDQIMDKFIINVILLERTERIQKENDVQSIDKYRMSYNSVYSSAHLNLT